MNTIEELAKSLQDEYGLGNSGSKSDDLNLIQAMLEYIVKTAHNLDGTDGWWTIAMLDNMCKFVSMKEHGELTVIDKDDLQEAADYLKVEIEKLYGVN